MVKFLQFVEFNWYIEKDFEQQMSISPVSSLSIYEYYYSLNRKKASPVAKELEEYGLKATDNDALNIAMLQRAKAQERTNASGEEQSESYSDRPWADLMNQLNITFNENPADDIEDIKKELSKLLRGVSDEELETEISDLVDYVEDLYVDFRNLNLNSIDTSQSLTTQLNTMATYNIASI